jgi:hypothetical protein
MLTPSASTLGKEALKSIGFLSIQQLRAGSFQLPTNLTFNAWQHSEPLHSAENALGVVFTRSGVVLQGGLLSARAY